MKVHPQRGGVQNPQDWTVFTCQGHSPLGHSVPPTIRARGSSWESNCVDRTMPHAPVSENTKGSKEFQLCTV